MEGVFAFFAELSLLGVFLFGEGRIAPVFHWFASVRVAAGAVLSGFFIVATNAWMQHPVGYAAVGDRVELTSLRALLGNPYARWQYLHVVSGALITGSMVMAGIGAFYLLAHRHEEHGRLFVRVGVSAGIIFSLFSLFPTGSFQGEHHTLPAGKDGRDGGVVQNAGRRTAGDHRHARHRASGADGSDLRAGHAELSRVRQRACESDGPRRYSAGSATTDRDRLLRVPCWRRSPRVCIRCCCRLPAAARSLDSTSTTPRRPLTACVSRSGSIWLGSRSSPHISPMCTARDGASRDRRTSRKRRRASPLASIETLRQRARKRGAFSRGGLGRQLLDRPRQLPRPVPVADEGRRVDALAPPEHVVDREDQQI